MSVITGMLYNAPKNLLPIFNIGEFAKTLFAASTAQVVTLEDTIKKQNATLASNNATFNAQTFGLTTSLLSTTNYQSNTTYNFLNISTPANATYLVTLQLNVTTIPLSSTTILVDISYNNFHLYYSPIQGIDGFGFFKTIAFKPTSGTTSFYVTLTDTTSYTYSFNGSSGSASPQYTTPLYTVLTL